MKRTRPGADPHHDPMGLIFEAYRMDELSSTDCRTILLNWALGMPDGSEYTSSLAALHSIYCSEHPDHPMTAVIKEGLTNAANPKSVRGRHTSRRKPPFGDGSA